MAILNALPVAFTTALEPAGISRSQQRAWLKRALADGTLERPVPTKPATTM